MAKDEDAKFFNKKEAIKSQVDSNASKDELIKLDKNFSYEIFLDGAKEAFKLIVSSYKLNALEQSKDLISTNVYKTFKKSMEENKDKKLNENNFKIAKLDASILKVEVMKKIAKIKVQFLSIQKTDYKESSTEVKDVWTFEKEINAQNPNWLLTEVNVE